MNAQELEAQQLKELSSNHDRNTKDHGEYLDDDDGVMSPF